MMSLTDTQATDLGIQSYKSWAQIRPIDQGGDVNYVPESVMIHIEALGITNQTATIGGGEEVLYETLETYASDVLRFKFVTTGDGSGLGVFNVMTSDNNSMTIYNGGKMYDDLAGTENERVTQSTTTDTLERVYIKAVASDTSVLRVDDTVTQWGDNTTGSAQLDDGWNTAVYDADGVNCPSVSIDVATMSVNTAINVFGLNTLTGDLTGNSIMTYMEIADGTPNHTTPGSGGATCIGDISSMAGLLVIDVWDETAFTGAINIANTPDIETIWINGYNAFTIAVDGLTSLGTLIVLDECDIAPSGDVSTCSALEYLFIYGNTITGSMSGITGLYNITILEDTSATLPNTTNLTALGNILANIVFDTANVNQILADVWANRDAAKTGAFRRLDFTRKGASGSPSGQGITDQSNLEAYRSPDPPGTASLWTIFTN